MIIPDTIRKDTYFCTQFNKYAHVMYHIYIFMLLTTMHKKNPISRWSIAIVNNLQELQQITITMRR